MNMKILAVVACIILAVVMFSPIATPPVKAGVASTPTIQYIFYTDQNSLFGALTSGAIDSMQWPLTQSEYTLALTSTNITVEPLSEAGEFEIAFNNNFTDGIQMNIRSPMNYTSFRNALNCLVDKAGVIAGPTLGGFATPSDTQVPTPLMAAYVNTAVSGVNYPWQYSATDSLALTILWNNNWYDHAVYPTLASLQNAFNLGFLAGNMTADPGSPGGYHITGAANINALVYSGSDLGANGWDGGNGAANIGIANTPVKPLIGYIRQNDARKDLGDYFDTELHRMGIPYFSTYKATLTAIRPFVLAAQLYDFATLGYSFGAPPNWWYSELTPAGIYANGPNPYLVQDANTTNYATAAFTDPTPATFQADQLVVQYNLVKESYFVAGYCPATYCAYKTGSLGQIDILGQGTQANGAQWENWISLNQRKTPSSNIFYLGIYNPPDMVNPIFQDTVFDFQISDEIFTYPIGANPYTIAPGSNITGLPAGGDLPWMAYAWKTELVNDPYNPSNPKWTNVTVWFRNDIYWQDGVPFTVADINYTIYINALYGDAYDNAAMVWAANVNLTTGPDAPYEANQGAANYAAPYFTAWGPYACSMLVKSGSWLNLYLPLYETVPEHLYKYIQPNSLVDAEGGTATDGLHGLWPGQAAVGGNLLAGAPWGLTGPLGLNNNASDTLIGTGPFAYRANTFFPTVGGGITLDEFGGDAKFFMTIAPGAIAFKYKWQGSNLASDQPEGGSYQIGLPDLVLLAAAYGTTGTPPSSVPITEVPGALHSWNPGADLAAPAGVVGLSDLVTLALHYNWYYGNYSYNAPYPPSEVLNGGP